MVGLLQTDYHIPFSPRKRDAMPNAAGGFSGRVVVAIFTRVVVAIFTRVVVVVFTRVVVAVFMRVVVAVFMRVVVAVSTRVVVARVGAAAFSAIFIIITTYIFALNLYEAWHTEDSTRALDFDETAIPSTHFCPTLSFFKNLELMGLQCHQNLEPLSSLRCAMLRTSRVQKYKR
jgi:hypothetical protein